MIDTPLKRCSAGMIARIGFGAITALDADVLLIDEVLAVGDANFQRKCATWLEQYRTTGGTLLFVSHNLGLVRSMTERAIWLDHGKVVVRRRHRRRSSPSTGRRWSVGRPTREEVRAKGQVRKLMEAARDEPVGRSGGARLERGPRRRGRGRSATSSTSGSRSRSPTSTGRSSASGSSTRAVEEVGAAASPAIPVAPAAAARSPARSGRCRSDPAIYFPVVAILSEDGVVRDRWQLDRAVVVDRNGDGSSPKGSAPIDIGAGWSGSGTGSR